MDVLLIQPRTRMAKRITASQEGFMPPMMLYYLANPLIEKGFKVDILDLAVYNINAYRFKSYIKYANPSIVGITCTTQSYNNAIEAAGYVKSINPEIKVVIGGPHVTFQANEALQSDYIDTVVIGEGDITFTQLVEHFLLNKHSLAEIKGIAYRSNGDIVKNSRQIINDINDIHYPSRNLLNTSRYKIPGVIQSSRGCPFQCKFCSAGALAGGKYRMRNVKSIMDEIDYLVTKLGINFLAFSDDTITGFPDRVKEICSHIMKRGYPINWVCESRVDVADRKLLELMAKSGCTSIQFGFESGNEEVLKYINKKITPKQIEDAVRLSIEFGIQPTGNFMIGFPIDTRETIKDTLDLALKIKKLGSVGGVAVLTPFPGTFIYNHAEELGVTIHSNDWDDFDLENPIISTRYLSLDDIRTIYFDFMVEHNKC